MTKENVIINMKDLMRYCKDYSGEYRDVEIPEEEDSQESEGREEILT